MRYCPNCGNTVMESNFKSIVACPKCNQISYIKRIIFEPVPQPKQPPTPPQKPTEKPYKPKDLTSIPQPVEPVEGVENEMEESKDE